MMKGKVIWIIYLAAIGAFGIWALNFSLSKFYGLGEPVIYDDNPLYGYRPLPNQDMTRFKGKRIKINNLSLRCNTDWDSTKNGKVLFLGNSVTYGGSYIDNDELFSSLVFKDDPKIISASGGVNGWGVGNIHGLLVKNGFFPAKQYVSVLLEGDFHRGVALINGDYFVTKKPYSAIHEVLNHYLTSYMHNQQGHFTGDFMKIRRMKLLVQEDAMRKLKEVDDRLKTQGFTHSIFISPTADQVFRGKSIDHDLVNLANKYELKLNYLLDEVREGNELKESEMFHDGVHLEVLGHLLWATKIRESLILAEGESKQNK